LLLNQQKIRIHFSEQLSNGLKIVNLVCKINEQAKEKLTPFIDKGITVHLIEKNKCGWCSHGTDNIYYNINKKELHCKMIEPNNHILIVYPEFPVINEPQQPRKKPFLILLDVDRVVNFSKTGDTTEQCTNVFTAFGDAYCGITFNKTIVDAINNWAKR